MGVFPSFEVIPAVDIQEGVVVQLVQGERGTGNQYGDPVQTAKHWVAAGAQTLHLVDLDGAFEGRRRNASAVARILETVDVPVQLGGGIRDTTAALSLLESGVDRVILGTAAIENPEVVSEISASFPEGVMVSLDAKNDQVVIAGWTEETKVDPAAAAVRFEDLGAAGILFTDVDVEGQLTGVRTAPVRRIVNSVSIPVVASGGVATIRDIQALYDVGAAAVVVGSALYEGRFSLQEAIESLRAT